MSLFKNTLNWLASRTTTVVLLETKSGLQDCDLQEPVQTKIFKVSWRVTN